MSFFQEYKRLDNLCKDLLQSDKGVTAYIEEMESLSSLWNPVADWDEAYNKLKKYRHIRNKIAHESYVCEEDLCTEADVQWLKEFYDKILSCSDPLALYMEEQRMQEKSYRMNQGKSANLLRGDIYGKEQTEKQCKRHYILKVLAAMLIIAFTGIAIICWIV